ncbi:MAG: DUF2974 domain-containing protein [Lachnospiraceae bacterium]|nr:DUF2974 domain-containing protein [Lachnospiraceae bacterium]
MSIVFPDNMVSYINFVGDRTFRQQKLNNTDIMLFTALISENIADTNEIYGYTLKELAGFKSAAGTERFLLNIMGNSPRYANVTLKNYRSEINESEETTFYAATFMLTAFETLIVFRGTDGSLMSWKENFNTLFRHPSYGHGLAKEYLESEIGSSKNPFMKFHVTGHSKGGNLALYASMSANARIQKKISDVIIYDAPGFMTDLREEPGFLNIKERISAYVPESCVIGKLMNQPCELKPVKSTGKGVFQHDTYNWISGPYGLEPAESTNDFSAHLSGQINDWIERIPVKDRQKVVNELFDVFKKNGIMRIEDLIHMDLRHILGMLMSATMLSSENRSLLMIIFRELRTQ